MGSCVSGGKVGCPLTRKSAIWSHSPPFHMPKCPWARYRTCIALDGFVRRWDCGNVCGWMTKLCCWALWLVIRTRKVPNKYRPFSRVCFEYIATELDGQIRTCIIQINCLYTGFDNICQIFICHQCSLASLLKCNAFAKLVDCVTWQWHKCTFSKVFLDLSFHCNDLTWSLLFNSTGRAPSQRRNSTLIQRPPTGASSRT